METAFDIKHAISEQDEEKRLHELRQYQILRTAPDISFDQITELAASITDAPKAMINLIYEDEQWSKSISGLSYDLQKIPRDRSICQYTIHKPSTFEITDLQKDERTKDFPYVKGDPYLRYYLGAPLITPNGYGIGALCVLGFEPGKATEEEKNNLTVLAKQVMAQLELRKKNLELEKHNRFQSNLMKILSHDIRSPLSGIIGIGELLLNMDSLKNNKDIQELLLNLKYSSEQLNQLVSDILNYTFTRQNEFKLELKDVEISDIVLNIKKLYKSSADLKSIDLSFNTSGFDKSIHLDAEKFKQIFGNLLSNAIKFTPEGGEIICNLSLDPSSQMFTLTVEDNGMGMSENTIQKILSGETPDTTEGTGGEKGTGLGTTIIYKFTKLHNGSLHISSSPEQGTTVTVNIPLDSTENHS